MDAKSKISTLWIVVMFNMAFADILTFITPGVLAGLMSGSADGLKITKGLLLVFALLIEIPIAMIFLSRVLKNSINKWINISAAAVTTLFVVGGGSLDPHYLFFASAEVICMIFIVLLAWKLPEEKAGK